MNRSRRWLASQMIPFLLQYRIYWKIKNDGYEYSILGVFRYFVMYAACRYHENEFLKAVLDSFSLRRKADAKLNLDLDLDSNLETGGKIGNVSVGLGILRLLRFLSRA